MAAVQEYLNGEGSYHSIAKKYGIDYERFRQLVIRAQAEGIESIKISHTNKKYPVRLNTDAHTISTVTEDFSIPIKYSTRNFSKPE